MLSALPGPLDQLLARAARLLHHRCGISTELLERPFAQAPYLSL
jgi:hypothetical protein